MGYINQAEIPAFTGLSLGRMLCDAITEYFADPQHQREFEEWKKEQEKGAGSND